MLGRRLLLASACWITWSMNVVLAQSTTATISGNVIDSSASAIPGATVTATELTTNISRGTHSAADGSYPLLYLALGSYRVEVTANGFKKFEQTGIVLEVNRNARVDAVLQVGALTETVEVKADAAMVETGSPVLGMLVNSQDVEEHRL